MNGSFWLGFFAFPAFFLALYVAYCLFVRLIIFLRDHGYFVEYKTQRNTEQISDYTLRHDIWFEKQRGPIFTGHWYREVGEEARVNRWIGLGRTNGRALMFFKSRKVD